jgi:hypothetical protein
MFMKILLRVLPLICLAMLRIGLLGQVLWWQEWSLTVLFLSVKANLTVVEGVRHQINMKIGVWGV